MQHGVCDFMELTATPAPTCKTSRLSRFMADSQKTSSTLEQPAHLNLELCCLTSAMQCPEFRLSFVQVFPLTRIGPYLAGMDY